MDLHTIREEAAKLGCVVLPVRSSKIYPDDIIYIACFAVGIPPKSFFEKTRRETVVFARALAFNIIVRENIMSPAFISTFYGLLDRTSVLYHVKILKDVFDDHKNTRLLKEWQRIAFLDFTSAFEEYKSNILKLK